MLRECWNMQRNVENWVGLAWRIAPQIGPSSQNGPKAPRLWVWPSSQRSSVGSIDCRNNLGPWIACTLFFAALLARGLSPTRWIWHHCPLVPVAAVAEMRPIYKSDIGDTSHIRNIIYLVTQGLIVSCASKRCLIVLMKVSNIPVYHIWKVWVHFGQISSVKDHRCSTPKILPQTAK